MPLATKDSPVKDAAWWLEARFQNWATWMKASDGPEGFPEHSCAGVIHGYMIHTADSDAAYDQLDTWLAETTNAAINGLKAPAERMAIYREYKVIACFTFTRGNYQDLLTSAKEHVRQSLERRGVWMGA